jgi:2,4-dienoyl-CoA reductase (NADPH2)
MAARKAFEKILEPGHIGSVKTRNRIIKSGAGMLMGHEDDLHMGEDVLAYYERLAKGGVGLLIVEAATVDYPWGARHRSRYRIDDDKYIEGWKELAEVIHRHGCPTFMQVNHDGPWQVHWGRETNPVYAGPPVAASPVYLPNPNDHHNEMPRALTIPEIEGIVEKFAKAAVRAKKAGFDGIDINAGSSHLFHNFFSPFWNKREDVYGGSVENRARLLVQVLRETKRLVGKEFPVSVIINGIEIGRAIGIDDSTCLTPEDSRAIAKLVAEAGADAIQVRSHWLGWHVGGFLPDVLFYPEPPIPVSDFPKEYNARGKGAGANIFLAAAIKKLVPVPVTVVGRMDPVLGEMTLREGLVDFIAMTRRLHADPELPNKLIAGRPEDIAPCTGCDYCLGGKGRCRINGLSGLPYVSIDTADKKKKVLVIGGGPAGMEAARVSALRGHDVTLWEKSGDLGGLLPVAAMVKGDHPEDLPAMIDYLKRQLSRLRVDVRLKKEAGVADIERMSPDVVFVATGGVPAVPEIRGLDRPNVVSGGELHARLKFFLRFFSPNTLRSLSKFYLPLGKKVVIVGGGIQGCELAEFLTKRGRKVTIVDKAEVMGEGLAMTMKEYLFTWFEKKGVEMIAGVREYVEIGKKGLTIVDREGEKRTIEADTVIPALPLKPDTGLADALAGKVPEVYAIGDCIEPSLIVDAVGTGLLTAREV